MLDPHYNYTQSAKRYLSFGYACHFAPQIRRQPANLVRNIPYLYSFTGYAFAPEGDSQYGGLTSYTPHPIPYTLASYFLGFAGVGFAFAAGASDVGGPSGIIPGGSPCPC